MTPFLADSVYPLSGKPYSRTIVTFRRNALLRETCMLVRLRTDMNSLLYSERQLYRGWEFSKAVAELANKFRDWYDNLPSDLRYHKNIPAPLYELQSVNVSNALPGKYMLTESSVLITIVRQLRSIQFLRIPKTISPLCMTIS